MLRSGYAFAALSACSFALVLAACSSSTDSTPAGGGTVDQAGAVPPGPGAMKAGDGDGVVLAISKLYLGDTDRSGNPDTSNGWKHFGFNLDGKVSTKSSTDLCKPILMAAPSDVYPDGDKGIDNSFGAKILPILLGFAPDAGDKVNQSISDGKFTILMKLDKLGSGTDYNPIAGMLYGGGDLGAAPKFDGTDKWPLINELLNNGNPDDPKVKFPKSYVANNTWVSSPFTAGANTGVINLTLSIAGYDLTLTINSAIVAMDLKADHKGATNGTIAGIIETEAFIGELKKVAGSVDKGLCSGATFDSIADQLRQASDILADGTQDPTKACSGISIGLGFDALPVQLGAVNPAATPKPSPCDMAGAGGGGTGGSGAGGAGGAGM